MEGSTEQAEQAEQAERSESPPRREAESPLLQALECSADWLEELLQGTKERKRRTRRLRKGNSSLSGGPILFAGKSLFPAWLQPGSLATTL